MIDTMLQYYLGIADPSVLADEEWASKFYMLEQIRKEEKQHSLKDMFSIFNRKKK